VKELGQNERQEKHITITDESKTGTERFMKTNKTEKRTKYDEQDGNCIICLDDLWLVTVVEISCGKCGF